jgi:hypothetical protein
MTFIKRTSFINLWQKYDLRGTKSTSLSCARVIFTSHVKNMDKKEFNKDLSVYLKAKVNGKKIKQQPIQVYKRRLNPMRYVRSAIRKSKMAFRRTLAFIRGDHHINLSNLGRDIFVIKYEDTPIGKFMIRMRAKFSRKKKEKESDDIDIAKVQETIRNNPLK